MIRGLGFYRDGKVVLSRDDLLHDHTDEGMLDHHLRDLIRTARSEEDTSAFLWLGLYQPTAMEMQVVADELDLPRLQVEDALNVRQRAKIELRGERLFVLLKVLDYIEATNDVETGQVSMFVDDHVVVTVRYGGIGDLQEVRERLEASPDLLREGALSVVHGVLDRVVDRYLEIGDELEHDVDAIQDSVFSPVRSDESQSIYRLKREVQELRRAVIPLVPMAHDITAGRLFAIRESMVPYFHDVSDHLLRVNDQVEGLDSLLTALLSASTQRLELQQNSDMRKISAWVAIAAVPTMIAGVYGMNFDNMPELHWEYGYFLILAVMLTACGLMYRAFKRSGWL